MLLLHSLAYRSPPSSPCRISRFRSPLSPLRPSLHPGRSRLHLFRSFGRPVVADCSDVLGSLLCGPYFLSIYPRHSSEGTVRAFRASSLLLRPLLTAGSLLRSPPGSPSLSTASQLS